MEERNILSFAAERSTLYLLFLRLAPGREASPEYSSLIASHDRATAVCMKSVEYTQDFLAFYCLFGLKDEVK
tara:strand:+ start:210 stop:425 length:216 start_codon:yes stop_codon:yes gene_type:complete